MKSEIKKKKSKEKKIRSSKDEESSLPRTSSPERNSKEKSSHRTSVDKNDAHVREGIDAISEFINSTKPLSKDDKESNKENMQKSSNKKDHTLKSSNEINDRSMKINSNKTVSADLRDFIGKNAPVINLNRITLEKVTQSSDSSDSENDDFVGNDEAEKVNEVVKKGRATPNSIILSMTSTKSSSYNRWNLIFFKFKSFIYLLF